MGRSGVRLILENCGPYFFCLVLWLARFLAEQFAPVVGRGAALRIEGCIPRAGGPSTTAPRGFGMGLAELWSKKSPPGQD